MPLQIHVDNIAAQQVYQRCGQMHGRYRYDVGMGGFAIANNPNHVTALGTSGAGPCQIIVVHIGPGHGALGHFAAHPNPDKIVQGVQKMVLQLAAVPSRIVLAAGDIGDFRDRFRYELRIVAQVRALYPMTRVIWPAAPVDDVWGACYYLPLAEELGMNRYGFGMFAGTGSPADGIHEFNY